MEPHIYIPTINYNCQNAEKTRWDHYRKSVGYAAVGIRPTVLLPGQRIRLFLFINQKNKYNKRVPKGIPRMKYACNRDWSNLVGSHQYSWWFNAG